MTRVSVFRVDLGVGGVVIASGSHVHPTHSCDGWGGWVCDLGTVVASSIFGWIRGDGSFTVVLPTFVLVSRIQLEEQYCVNDHLVSVVSVL